MRFAVYAGTSVALAAGVVFRALTERANFYSATIYLAQSNACIMILSNLLLLNLGLFVLGLQRLLYGPLRPIEVEQLYEKAWFAITETCLAMTIFKTDLGAWFTVMFVSLLLGKVWGWIGEGRVEILEQQPPTNPRLFHTRLASSLGLSVIFDLWLLHYTVGVVREQSRPNMMVMFAFEFAVLSVNSFSTCCRYTISLREMQIAQKQIRGRVEERKRQIAREREEMDSDVRERHHAPTDAEIEDEIDVPGWEDKGKWIFYLDLATDFIKLVLYLTFFCVLCVFYGMPIHIIRDVAITIRSFYKRITDFVRYRQATQDMHARYPDATAQEIGADNVCIICREPMREWETGAEEEGEAQRAAQGAARVPAPDDRLRPKKLPCGHVLHFACLRSWLERQQNCPTCRQSVLVSSGAQANGQANNGAVQGNAGQVRGAPGQQQRPAARQNRIRFFNFGPLRLGFGAGPDFQRLAQDMQNAPGAQGQPGQFPLQPQPGIARPTHPGRLQFQGQPALNTNFQQIRTQIETIEQQVLQEANSLRVSSQELITLRALIAELARLRSLHHSNATQPTRPSTENQAAPMGLPPLPRTAPAPAQIFAAPENQAYLHSLPEGLTVPQGWSVLPLSRVNMPAPSGFMYPAPPGPAHQQPVNVPAPTNGPFNPPPQTNLHAQRPPEQDQAAHQGIQTHEHTQPPLQQRSSSRVSNVPFSNDSIRPMPSRASQASHQTPGGAANRSSGHRSGLEREYDNQRLPLPLQSQGASEDSSRQEEEAKSERPERSVETRPFGGDTSLASSTGRADVLHGADGVQLPNWRPHTTTVEDGDDSD